MAATATLPPPPALTDLADRPISLFLDFDGTLVPIAQTPDGIAPARDLARRLEHLSQRHGGRLAVISGRAIAALELHCGPLQIACAGSHGADGRLADGSVVIEPEAIGEDAAEALAQFAEDAGLVFERKAHGAALHWRSAPERESECLAFVTALSGQHGLSLKSGKFVAELVRPGADKGAAVRAFMAVAPFAGSLPVFIGDDVTDEDGFVASEEIGGFGIAVGERPSQNARFALADPAAVHHWLGL